MDRSIMEDFVANAALLAAHFSQQCEKSISEQQSTAQDLRHCADQVGQQVTAGKADLDRYAREAIRDALARELSPATRALDEAAQRLRQQAAQWQAISSAPRNAWKPMLPMLMLAVALAAGSGGLAWHNLQRAERARVQADVFDALRQVTITSCDGHPCMKLEDGQRRWEKNDDYVLVDAGRGGANAR